MGIKRLQIAAPQRFFRSVPPAEHRGPGDCTGHGTRGEERHEAAQAASAAKRVQIDRAADASAGRDERVPRGADFIRRRRTAIRPASGSR